MLPQQSPKKPPTAQNSQVKTAQPFFGFGRTFGSRTARIRWGGEEAKPYYVHATKPALSMYIRTCARLHVYLLGAYYREVCGLRSAGVKALGVASLVDAAALRLPAIGAEHPD